MSEWNENQPIYRQLADTIRQQILQGVWQEGEALPSVRVVAADMKINHLTVMKGYQLMVDEGLIEKKRGQGMFVAEGAMSSLREEQQQQFIEQQIPAIAAVLTQTGISLDEFVAKLRACMGEK